MATRPAPITRSRVLFPIIAAELSNSPQGSGRSARSRWFAQYTEGAEAGVHYGQQAKGQVSASFVTRGEYDSAPRNGSAARRAAGPKQHRTDWPLIRLPSLPWHLGRRGGPARGRFVL